MEISKATRNYLINGCQIYFMAFVICYLSSFLLDTTFSGIISDHLLRLLSYIALPLLFFKIYILDDWRIGEKIVITLFLLLGIITWRIAHNQDLLLIFPLIIGAKNIDYKKIVSWFFYLSVIFVLSMCIFSLSGIIPNLIYKSLTRPTRYSLGLIYTSDLATMYLYIVLAFCYLKFEHLNWLSYLTILFGDVVVMKLTNTRLDFLAVLLLIPVMILAQQAVKGKRYAHIVLSFSWMAVPIAASCTIFGGYFYNSHNHVMSIINSLSSGRLQLTNTAFHRYNIKLFGQSIKEHPFSGIKGQRFANRIGEATIKYFYIDSSYIRMLLLWGLLVFVLLIMALTFIAIRSVWNRTYILAAIILIVSINLMFEPHVIQLMYNPFLLALLARTVQDKNVLEVNYE